MGKPIEKIAHPEELGGCGSSDALQVFKEEDGSYNGYCYACKTYVKDPYAQHPEGYNPPPPSRKSPEVVQKEIKEALGLPIRAIPDRGLTQETCERFGTRVGLDTRNGQDIASHYYPYTNHDGEVDAFNVRICDPKKFFGIGQRKESNPFGWDKRLKTKALYITEGEIDAMSLYQILKESAKEWAVKNGKQWDDRYVPDIISLPTGASSASRVLSRLADTIEREYREVRIVFDNDEAGQNATQDAVKALDGRKFKLFVCTLPKKDVNECMLAGMSQDVIKACVYNASEKISGKVIRSNELRNLAKERPKMGSPWPWPTMTELTRGKRLGEVYYFGSGV
jgi:twinkle protein